MAADEIDAVTAGLVASFWDDPGYAAVFREADRGRALDFLFRRLLALRLEQGVHVWVADPGDGPVAMVSFATSAVSFGVGDYLRHGLLKMPFLFGLATVRRMLASDDDAGELRKAHRPSEPHAWVSQLGVHPDHQGRGLGRTLLDAALARIDRDALPTGIMTTRDELVAWYARFGFALCGSRPSDAGFTTHMMLRPACASS